MGDLHSIAYSSLLHNSSPLGYGLHNYDNNLGVFNADMSQYFFELESSISSSTPPFLSHFESTDFSTGYLQDALFEFSSKRRRLEFCSSSSEDDDQKLDDCTKRVCRSPSHPMNYFTDYEYMSTIMANFDSAEPTSEEDGSLLSEMIRTKEEAISSSSETFDTTSSSQKQFSSVNSDTTITQSDSDKGNLRSIDPRFPSAGGVVDEKRGNKIMLNKKVVYPFALVKPGGIEGAVTLNDINQRILMPPNRPVRHPVGDFACRPLISSADGPGLSGKAVVALTRIHTQGKGTITIVRTRG